jgi:hypothetical protein
MICKTVYTGSSPVVASITHGAPGCLTERMKQRQRCPRQLRERGSPQARKQLVDDRPERFQGMLDRFDRSLSQARGSGHRACRLRRSIAR